MKSCARPAAAVMEWFREHNMNFAGWARSYEFNENTAWVVLKRFSGRTKRPRAGTIAERVIQALETTTDIRICGGAERDDTSAGGA